MIRAIVVTIGLVAVSTSAEAQVAISGGLTWSGGYDLGASGAQLRTNAPGATAPPFTWFNVDARLAPAPGGEVRVGVAITPRLAIEGGALFARRRLGFDIGGDPEAGVVQLKGESLQHYVFDAGVLWQLPFGQGARFRSFAGGGGGYLRQLHQDRTLVESGQIYYATGSARYWLRGRPESNRSIGLRGDVRFNVRRGAIDFADRARLYPTFSLLTFLAL